MKCRRRKRLHALIPVRQSVKTSARWTSSVRPRIACNKTAGNLAGKVDRRARLAVNNKSAIFDNAPRRLHHGNEKSRKTWKTLRDVVGKTVKTKIPDVHVSSYRNVKTRWPIP